MVLFVISAGVFKCNDFTAEFFFSIFLIFQNFQSTLSNCKKMFNPCKPHIISHYSTNNLIIYAFVFNTKLCFFFIQRSSVAQNMKTIFFQGTVPLLVCKHHVDILATVLLSFNILSLQLGCT